MLGGAGQEWVRGEEARRGGGRRQEEVRPFTLSIEEKEKREGPWASVESGRSLHTRYKRSRGRGREPPWRGRGIAVLLAARQPRGRGASLSPQSREPSRLFRPTSAPQFELVITVLDLVQCSIPSVSVVPILVNWLCTQCPCHVACKLVSIIAPRKVYQEL